MNKYVYGVIPAGTKPPMGPGVDGAQPSLVKGDGLAAIVSEIGAEPLLDRGAIDAHSRVLDQALSETTVLPMRFGVVMADDDAVREALLEAHHDDLERQLGELQGKVELKLRATYEGDVLMREVVAGDPEVARLRASLQGAPEAATYYARIQLGELVAAAVSRRREHDADAMMEELTPLAVASVTSEPDHERVVVNASFLVDRERLDEFDFAVDRAGRTRAGRMRMKYTGPLPPYSFVALGAGA